MTAEGKSWWRWMRALSLLFFPSLSFSLSLSLSHTFTNTHSDRHICSNAPAGSLFQVLDVSRQNTMFCFSFLVYFRPDYLFRPPTLLSVSQSLALSLSPGLSLAIHVFRVNKRHVRWEGTSQMHKSTCDTLMLLDSKMNSLVAAGWNPQLLANWIRKKTFPKVRLT